MFMNPFLDYFKDIDLFTAKSVTTYVTRKYIGRNKLFVECLKGITDILVKENKTQINQKHKIMEFCQFNKKF